MLQTQLKLKLTRKQEALLSEWLWRLTGVYNYAIRKIELDARDGIYYSRHDFQNLLASHGQKLGIPSHTLQGTLTQAYTAWERCFKKIGGKPRLKSVRNKLNSIAFPDPLRAAQEGRIALPGLKSVRFHRQDIPAGRIKCGRIVRRASGWYLCLFIEAERAPIARQREGVIGIDPGFRNLLTFSSGKKVAHPKELQQVEQRLAQAQRGGNRKLVARLHERIRNQRKDRNHKLSLSLIQRNAVIVFSKDNVAGIARTYGKSVAGSGHAQLRSMLDYKSRAGGSRYLEVTSRNSTRICSACGALSGPQGRAGLSVRHWTCGCGAVHDRDQNAAINTLLLGLGKPSNDLRNAA